MAEPQSPLGILEGNEVIALWRSGREKWNEWVKHHPSSHINFSRVDFMMYADFGDEEEGEVSFKKFNFPDGGVNFSHASFGNTRVDFDGCDFGNGKADFSDVKFEGPWVSFAECEFGEGDANFKRATFGNANNAKDTNFTCSFWSCSFGKGSVEFDEAKFASGDVDFSSVDFGDGSVSFSNAVFGHGKINFEQTLFAGDVFMSDMIIGKGLLTFKEAKFNNGSVAVNSRSDDGRFNFQFSMYHNTFGKGEVSFEQTYFDVGILMGENSFSNREVIFKNADLTRLNIKELSLDNTDLRGAKYVLDDNSIRETRFSPESSDPYSIIRRKYTGFNFIILSILTLLALAPYIVKAIVWSFIGNQEQKLIALGETIIQKDPSLLQPVQAAIEQTLNGLNEFPTWYVVIGGAEKYHILAIVFSILALITISVRAYVTFKVSGIRDAEERSSHAPALVDYQMFYRIHHYFLRYGTVGILLMSLFGFYNILNQPVWL